MSSNARDDLALALIKFSFSYHNILYRPTERTPPKGMTPTQLRALTTIYEFGTMTMSFLGQEILVSKQQLTKIIASLVDSGLVERRQDEENRRRWFVSLTEAGNNMVERIHQISAFPISIKLQNLTDSEVTQMTRSLQNIRLMLDKMNDGQPKLFPQDRDHFPMQEFHTEGEATCEADVP